MPRGARSAQTPECRVSPEGLVIVTGSSGFIGARLVERLAAAGFTVAGFDQVGPPHPPAVAECIDIDLKSEKKLREAMTRVRHAYGGAIASVVHLAAFYDFSGEESPLYDEITVKGTQRLLRALRGFDVGQFVFSSTMLVHAQCEPGERIDEDWPIEPKWPYPQSKVKAEAVIRRARGAIPAVILRMAGVYSDRCNSIPLAHQIQRIHDRRLISHVFPGDTSRGQAFVHVDDVVDALVAAVRRRRELPEETVLLIGEEETLSYDALQRAFGRLLHGEDWETREIPKGVAKVGAWLQDAVPGEEPFIQPWMIDLADDHFALDVSRARRLLGWSPKLSLRKTLPKMVAALRDDPAAWYRDNKLEPSARAVAAKTRPKRKPAASPTRRARAASSASRDQARAGRAKRRSTSPKR